MRHIRDRARWVAGVGALIALLPAGACSNLKDDLLRADDPDIITPGAVQSAEGADALRIGALDRLKTITAGGENSWMLGGLLVDEWKSSDTFSQRNETDERKVQDSNANVQTMLRALYRPRVAAFEALAALRQYKPTPASNLGQMYWVLAFAEMTLAENFCNGTPFGDASTGEVVYGEPITNAAAFAMALAHADSGLTFTSATDANTVSVRHALNITKARILINLGRFAEAATAVSAVPTNYQFLATFSLTTGSNQIWSLNTSAKRWTVGDSFDTSGLIRNAIPFASLKDPRVPVTGTATGTSPAGRGFDGATNFITLNTFGRTDGTPIVSGIDARLMEAEAKLQANDIPGMMTILNALRAAPQNLGPLTSANPLGTTPAMAALGTPANRDAAIALYFREKALWTFSRGQRLPDLRRLVRQYGRTQDQVFPVGTFFKTNQPYGNDVNFPVTRDELNNPQFTACINRNA
jgi:starch-binding outer membrane protein, SusD/RagB family